MYILVRYSSHLLLSLHLAFGLNCQVPEIIDSNGYKCYPDLIANEASPSTVCMSSCKKNPIRFKHRCNQDGNWDIPMSTTPCDDIKMCQDPANVWFHWSWKCTLGYQQGSTCIGTCHTDDLTNATIQCQGDGTWKSDKDLNHVNTCYKKYFLLVTTGQSKDGSTNSTEVIDLENAAATCQPLPDFKTQTYQATGGLLNNKIPVICGGRFHEEECNPLDGTINSTIDSQRDSASVAVNGDLWVTGGGTESDSGNKSFFMKANGEITKGPDLPGAVTDHCIVSLNNNEFAIIGGNGALGFSGNTTWIYNFASQQWTKGPELKLPRFSHACAIFKDIDDRKKIIVTGGLGRDTNSPTQTTEVLDFQVQIPAWIEGPELPIPIRSHSMISLYDVAYIIGGQDDTNGHMDQIHKLEYRGWTLLESQKLQVPRCNFVAMLIPAELTTCS